jgi:DNA repair/transcription protein MET18/MMS19
MIPVLQSCLPLLLEKLSSEVLTAKLDALSVLESAAPVYGAVAMEPFLHQLWTLIEREASVVSGYP